MAENARGIRLICLISCLSLSAGGWALAAEETNAGHVAVADVTIQPSDLWPEFIPRIRNEYFVAPDGRAANKGTKESAWDLASTLAGKHPVPPGSVVWLRGGVYPGGQRCDLKGNKDAPVIVRRYPGEWATIDLNKTPGVRLGLQIRNEHVWFWGIEVTDSSRDRKRRQLRSGVNTSGIAADAPYTRLINLVVHEVENNSPSKRSVGTEIYGCLACCNGGDDNLGHNWYPQNNDPDQPKVFEECIDCNSGATGFHMYGSPKGLLNGFTIIGCVTFNNGASKIGPGKRKQNIIIGGGAPGRKILVRDSFSWARSMNARNWEFGYGTDKNEDVTLLDNYVVGEVWFRKPWQSITMKGNTFYSNFSGHGERAPGYIDIAKYPDNTYLTARPDRNRVFVRPNKYEKGRGHIIVYNWERKNEVTVDLKGVLEKGEPYEIRDAQNFFATPVRSGVYEGAPLSLPMAGLRPAQPISAPGAITAKEYTHPDFTVFVCLGRMSVFQRRPLPNEDTAAAE